MPDYISIADFAQRAGVSKQSIYQRIEKDLNPFVKLISGRKAIDTSALALFNTIDSTDSIDKNEQVKSKESTDSKDKLIETLENYVKTLNNQLIENNEAMKREQESNKSLHEENKKIQDDNCKLTNQLTKLSNDFSELASRAQVLQGHMQQQTLGTGNADAFTVVEGTAIGMEKAESKRDTIEEKVDCVDQMKKKGLFARIFG